MSVPPGPLLALSRYGFLLLASAAAAEALARAGAPVVGARGGGSLREFGASLLAGLVVVSLGLAGLALAGLFYPSLAVFVALAGVASGSRGLRGALVPAVLGTLVRERALAPALAILGAALPALATLALPESDGDAMGYGLGVGWLSLMLHRAPLEMVPHVFHLPLLAEHAFALPLALGDDRLARLFSALALAGAFCVAAPAGPGGRGAGWLAAVLPWSLYLLPYISVHCKSDALAASLMVAGAFLRLDGRTALGALLTGAAVAAKLTVAPLALLFWVFVLPPRSAVVRSCLAGFLPLVPWLAKNWLAVGDPLYPLMWRVFRPFSWGPMNDASYVAHATPLWERGIPSLGFAGALFTSFSREATLALAALPLLLGRWDGRRAAWGALAGAFLTVALSRVPRYLLPAEWLLLALLARRLAAAPFLPPVLARRPPVARAFVAALALWCVARAWTVMPPRASVRDAGRPWVELRAEALGMTGEGAELAGRARAPRLLGIDTAVYPYPARILFAGGESETPLVWQWARESADGGRLAARFRQAGAGFVIHNFMNSGWAIIRQRCFPWDDRSLALYLDFCSRRLAPVAQSARRDQHAGYTLFRVSGPGPARLPYFLPGAEGVMARAWIMRGSGRTDLALGELARLHRALNGAGIVASEAGSNLALRDDWRGAFLAMESVMKEGLMDATNLLVFGRAAMENGRWEIADPILARMAEAYPEAREVARIMRARAMAELALKALSAGNRVGARERLGEADRLMEGSEAVEDPWAVEESMRSRAALDDAWRRMGGR